MYRTILTANSMTTAATKRALNYDIVADAMQFVKEEMSVNVQFYKGRAFSVEPPNFVELEIVETEPAMRRCSAIR